MGSHINNSINYQYLNDLSNFEARTEDELRFKYAIEWALKTIEMQAVVLDELDDPMPNFRIIQGGKE